ncbi:MAG: deoxyguanosinetriphosphate triphosphohydrolase [Anaerolineales bacterium]
MTRAQQEKLEAQMLAPYALKSAASRGRFHEEHEPAYRTVFQRDRDRILHTTAFRRLEYKTQVFVNHEGDYYRTRLTHTLEVAQVGESLARALGANRDLVETICLSHDLGHPPFGHAGEAALNRLMAEHGGFEHNKQTYRIVTKLERRYPTFPGLNLSYEALEGIVKHETEYDKADAEGFSPELRASFEAQIANIADELAYNVHDLDDGLRAGLLLPEQLAEVGLWQRLMDSLGWRDNTITELKRHELVRELKGMQINDVLLHTQQLIDEHTVQTPADVQALERNIVAHSPEMADLNREWKHFLYANMYRHYRVVRMSSKAQRFISDLFNEFVREPTQLPFQTQVRIEVVGLERAVTDYIAGMTDRYALQEWERLFGPFTRP